VPADEIPGMLLTRRPSPGLQPDLRDLSAISSDFASR
jgi:hypothetical protein